ncbi:hypothetical protein QUB63_10335 [Microcoleus sp. ARI1-B5]
MIPASTTVVALEPSDRPVAFSSDTHLSDSHPCHPSTFSAANGIL